MLVLALTDLRELLRIADVAAAMSVEGQLGTDRVFAAELQALRPHPGQALSAANLTRAAGRLRRRRLAPRPGLQPGAGRLLAALLAAGPRRRPRHRRRTPRRWPAASWPAPSTTRWCCRSERRVESNGNFHGAPVGLRARLPRDRRRRRGLDQRAAYRPLPRQGPQPRAAAVPRRRPRRRQRAHDRAVHPGRDRLRAEAARGPGVASTRSPPAPCRRTTSRWAGRPPASCAASVDGLTRVLAIEVLTAARALDLRAPLDAVAGHRRRRARCCATPASRAPAPTATSRPRSRPPSGSSSSGAVLDAVAVRDRRAA